MPLQILAQLHLLTDKNSSKAHTHAIHRSLWVDLPCTSMITIEVSSMQASDDAPSSPNPIHNAPFQRGAEWLRGQGESNDVVMSSRVRLARNIAGFPFTTQASRIDRSQILEACKQRILHMSMESADDTPSQTSAHSPNQTPNQTPDQISAPTQDQFMWIDLHNVGRDDRNLLVERQLMSRQHAKGKLTTGQGGLDEPRSVAVLVPDERVSIMVNEEDHLRLQSMRSGLRLSLCLQEANKLDDLIEAGIDYAYHPRFGYLTACPTNVGTGLRLSVMLHLPGLKLTGELDKVRRAAHDMGLAVRGFYGEGSDSPGEFYQLSNQTTLGKSDEMLLREMEHDIIPRVVGYERHARKNLLTNQRDVIEDQIWRSVGTLGNARMMRVEEAMQLLSLVRLGVLSGIVNDIPIDRVHMLLLSVQPTHLQRSLGSVLTQQQRRIARATHIRSQIRTPLDSSDPQSQSNNNPPASDQSR
jgi:protein arginine kinase